MATIPSRDGLERGRGKVRQTDGKLKPSSRARPSAWVIPGLGAAFAGGLVAAVVLGTTSCGASINAVYEADVRFERCMALDSRPDVKPTLRRECWDGWVQYYTFGQTRDRVDYAKRRRRQLSMASDFDEAEWAPAETSPSVPEPTDVMAPPPAMMIVDAGAAEPATDAADTKDAAPKRGESCTAVCEAQSTQCLGACTTGSCEKACSAKYKRCTRACF